MHRSVLTKGLVFYDRSHKATCHLVLAIAGCLVFVIPIQAYAQHDPLKQVAVEKLVDDIFSIQDLDLNYEELYENLLQMLANPVDLNRATADELRSLWVLRESQITSFLAYRDEYGPLVSVYELQSIPDFDTETLHRLMPLVRVDDASAVFDKSLLKRIAHEKNNYFITRYGRTLEEKKGYRKETNPANRYAGSPDKIYTRFRINRSGDFSLGFTAEKDAGEAIRWNPSKHEHGMDYYSIHGQVINKGRLRNIIAGDFLAQFGQGLVLGGGFGVGKGSETITTIRRSNLGFIPYTSINESGFFRGSAISYSPIRNLVVHGFVSSLRRDGLIHQDSSVEESSLISSFATTGYHRTPGELVSRQQVNETNYGAVLNYKNQSLEAGFIADETRFSLPITRTSTLYNKYSFQGKQNLNMSAFLNFTKNNITFFSEVAQSLHHGGALVAGLLGSITRQMDVSLLYRNYNTNFYSFYSNAVAENTIPQNESGIYWGVKYAFNKKYSIAGYLDLFHFPWLRYRCYAPGDGSESLLRFNYQPSKSVVLYVQFREETKTRNLETNYYQTGNGTKRNYWINCEVDATPGLNFKTRVQASTYTLQGQTTRGLAVIQDVSFDLGRFSFSTRYALFDTDNYDNRLYGYERDVWLAFSFPAYFGVGIRRYALVQYRLTKKVDLWLRWAQTRYSDRTSVGSEGETIRGNTANDIKLQARIRF